MKTDCLMGFKYILRRMKTDDNVPVLERSFLIAELECTSNFSAKKQVPVKLP